MLLRIVAYHRRELLINVLLEIILWFTILRISHQTLWTFCSHRLFNALTNLKRMINLFNILIELYGFINQKFVTYFVWDHQFVQVVIHWSINDYLYHHWYHLHITSLTTVKPHTATCTWSKSLYPSVLNILYNLNKVARIYRPDWLISLRVQFLIGCSRIILNRLV